MKTKAHENHIITSKSELEKVFHSGIKKQKNIGIEFEKLAVRKNDHKAVEFFNENGILSFLKKYINTGEWEFILENQTPIGLKHAEKTITLEPGSQFELSLNPVSDVHKIKRELDNHNLFTAFLADEMDFQWIGYGIQPISIWNDIEIIPKKRYEFMSKYLPKVALLPLVMMRETAGVQVAIDFDSEKDAIEKFSLALKLSPIISTMYSNSPIRNGKDTGYKSYRASSWLDTDPKRCGLVSKKLFDKHKDFIFADYVNILLDVPMIFIEKDKKYIPMSGMTFREYFEEGFKEYKATIKDWETHMSLYFPEVRLKNYIEIRNHDSQKSELLPSIPALWKGILYNETSIKKAKELLSKLSYEDFENIRALGPKFGLDFEIKGTKISDIAFEIIKISKAGLEETNLGEEIYLEPLEKLVKNKMTPADLILENWYGTWNQDIAKLVEYSKLY